MAVEESMMFLFQHPLAHFCAQVGDTRARGDGVHQVAGSELLFQGQ